MKKFKFPMRYVPISATILVFFIVYLIEYGFADLFIDTFHP